MPRDKLAKSWLTEKVEQTQNQLLWHNWNIWLSTKYLQVTEECLVGAPATAEEDNHKWRVPFRLPKTIEHFEVRLGPPGGDKVYFYSYL